MLRCCWRFFDAHQGLHDNYGTDTLNPIHLRPLKAVAVLRMLERRTGEESFRNTIRRFIMQTAVGSIDNAAAPSKEGSRSAKQNIPSLATKEFFRLLSKVGGIDRKTAKLIEAQWIRGRGCARINVAYDYSMRRNVLELAILQQPAPASVSSAGIV